MNIALSGFYSSFKVAGNLIIHETNHKNFKSQQMALVQCQVKIEDLPYAHLWLLNIYKGFVYQWNLIDKSVTHLWVNSSFREKHELVGEIIMIPWFLMMANIETVQCSI